MLLKFVLSNYRSFNQNATLDMEACSIKEYAENVFLARYGSQPINVLKSISLLGANSAGKSNLFKGFELMRYIVINSAKESQHTKNYIIEPFKLNTESEKKPSLFECTIMVDNIIYRYGFKIDNNEVDSEWLYMIVKRREETVFLRTKSEFEIIKKFNTDLKNKLTLITELTRSDALFLTVLAQFNIEIAKQICGWFAKNIIYADPNLEDGLSFTAELLADPSYNALMNEIIEKSDLGFSSIERQVGKMSDIRSLKKNGQDLASPIEKLRLRSNHLKYDSKNKVVEKISLELTKHESSGTQKFIALLGPMIKVLIDGGVFWIDDFDAKIHPYIITMIMNLFNSEKYNRNGAQLVSVSYNQQILKKLRRDQIVFLNKDIYGASSLSALYIYNPHVRSNAIFDKEYLQGHYGGVPNVSDVFHFDPKGKLNKAIMTNKKSA